jgi:hypothetical protein
MANRTKVTAKKKEAFLTRFIETNNVSAACRMIGVSRRAMYEHRKTDEKFAAEWADAEEEIADNMEAEAHRRAVEGVEKPVGFYRGTPGAYVQEYSDTLLIFLLKGARPEKFKDRVEATGKDGAPLNPPSRIHVYLPDNGRADRH